MVSSRAMSLRSVRNSWVFSTWPVCLRSLSWRSCSRISRSLVLISPGERSRISFEVMTERFGEGSGRGGVALDEAAVEWQLGVGEAKGLLGDGERDAGEFEEDGAGLDHGDVELDRALALAHADL